MPPGLWVAGTCAADSRRWGHLTDRTMIVPPTPTFKPVRLLIDPPLPGAWNMALDETLLESALNHGVCTARVYEWEHATLSLGYFQKPAEARADPRWAGMPAVRRLSGGGAIVHHHELTYSLAVPPDHPAAGDPSALYSAIHEAVISRLAGLGVSLAIRGTLLSERNSAFLCFARGDAMDVVLGPNKVLGSAQRRRRGAILQHGSLVLKASQFAPEVPGLTELTDRAWTAADLKADLARDLAQILGTEVQGEALTQVELDRAATLRQTYIV
jgi:lipoate-protein ligase A